MKQLLRKLPHYLLFIFMFFGMRMSKAQDNYPVSCVPMVSKGHRQLSGYLNPIDGLKVNLILKDLDQTDIEVYLNLRISGLGIEIFNPVGFIPSNHLTLQRGSLLTLSGSDLEEYFNPANLQTQGIDQSFLYQGGSLPQGTYRIQVTAYEVQRGRQVSNLGEVSTYVFLADPPLLISPTGTLMGIMTDPQMLLFQWQLPGLPFIDADITSPISYTFRLAKVGSAATAANALDRVVIVTEILSTSYLLTSSATLLLEEGQEYVWQVEIDNPEYKDYYRNRGISQPATFVYSSPPCESPEVLSSSILMSGYSLRWGAVSGAVSYDVEYCRIDSTEIQEAWTQLSTPMTAIDLPLDKESQYKAKVIAICRNGKRSQPSDEIYLLGLVPDTGGSESPSSASVSDGAVAVKKTRDDDSKYRELRDTTPEEASLESILNPFSNPIYINDGEVGTPPSLEEMLAQLATLPTPDCGPGFTSGTDCEEETVQTYTGSVELNIAPGDILAINGFKVLVTEGGANGKGLLYYNAFGGVTIPVNFVGVKAWEAPNGVGGCVYAGEMPVLGSDNSVLDKDVQSQLLALLAKVNDPDSFSGSFGKALEELKNKATELKDQATISPEDWTQLNTYIVASKTGFSDWQTDINSAFGSDVPEEVQTALARLGEIEEELAELSSCASDNIPEDGGGDSYRNLTALLRLACSMEFDKLIAKQEEAKEISKILEQILRGWYKDPDGIWQFDKYAKGKNRSFTEKGVRYLDDGSVIFTDQYLAYKRLVDCSKARGREQSLVIIDNEYFVLPDYKNELTSIPQSALVEYGISFDNGIIKSKHKTGNIFAHFHTHPGGGTPSFSGWNSGLVEGDAGFAR